MGKNEKGKFCAFNPDSNFFAFCLIYIDHILKVK